MAVKITRSPMDIDRWVAGDGLIDRKQVADLLDINYGTLKRWCAEGDGPDHSHKYNYRLYYSFEDVNRWLIEHAGSLVGNIGNRYRFHDAVSAAKRGAFADYLLDSEVQVLTEEAARLGSILKRIVSHIKKQGFGNVSQHS